MARRHAVQLGAWAAHGMWRWRFQSSAVSSQQLLQFPAASLRNLSPRRCQSSPRHGRFQAGTLSRAPAAMDLLNDHHALHFPADLASRAHSHHRCGCSLLPTSQSPPPAISAASLAGRSNATAAVGPLTSSGNASSLLCRGSLSRMLRGSGA